MVNDEFRKSVQKDLTGPTIEEQACAMKRILRYYSLIRKKTMVGQSVSELIKTMGLQPFSSRLISGIFYPKGSMWHRNQYQGRELKRWAANELGELFNDRAIVKEHWMKGMIGDYWHE